MFNGLMRSTVWKPISNIIQLYKLIILLKIASILVFSIKIFNNNKFLEKDEIFGLDIDLNGKNINFKLCENFTQN
jgi:hypothetical protein